MTAPDPSPPVSAEASSPAPEHAAGAPPERVRVHRLRLGERELRLRGRDLDDALDAAARAEGAGERGVVVPYWAELWPSARVLAAYLVGPGASEVAGRLVLELGAGLGLGAIAAALGGARAAVATDHAGEALAWARANALDAGVGERVGVARLDWREPARWAPLAGAPPPPWPLSGRFEVAVGADLIYERANQALLLDALDHVLARDGALLLADPRRQAAEGFAWAAAERGYAVEVAACARVAADGALAWGAAADPSLHALGQPVFVLRLRASAGAP